MSKRESLPQIETVTSEMNDVSEALAKESDRGLILVSCASLDDSLEHLLRLRFSVVSKKPKSAINPLFDTFGPLSSFSAKIKISYAFDVIEKWVYDDLNHLRRLRNKLAHNACSISLGDPDILKITEQLSGADKAAESMMKAEDKRKQASLNDKPSDNQTDTALMERYRIVLTVGFIKGILHYRSILLESEASIALKLMLAKE